MPEIQERLSGALSDRYRVEREPGAGGMAFVLVEHWFEALKAKPRR